MWNKSPSPPHDHTKALVIDTYSFGVSSSAKFAVGSNKKAFKKKHAKQDFDFLYDEKKGGLYFNLNAQAKALALVASS